MEFAGTLEEAPLEIGDAPGSTLPFRLTLKRLESLPVAYRMAASTTSRTTVRLKSELSVSERFNPWSATTLSPARKTLWSTAIS